MPGPSPEHSCALLVPLSVLGTVSAQGDGAGLPKPPPLLWVQRYGDSQNSNIYIYRGFESPRYSHPGVSSFRGPGGSLRRILLLLPGAARSLCLSAASLKLITSSQKEVIASIFLPSERSAAISAAGNSTGPMAAVSSARCALNAEHSSSVCCAESGSTQ